MEFISGPPGFKPLDPTRAIKRTRRHLPHWTQDGATYFVTFHLGDSLPQERLEELRILYKQFATQKFACNEEQDERRREILRRVESWLDAGSGDCWLAHTDVSAMMSNSMLHFHGKRYELGAHCVMPNHVHAVFRPLDNHSLDDVLHSWKGYTADQMNQMLSRKGSVWVQESFDTIVRDARHLARVVQYIGRNPAKADIPRERWRRWVNPEWERIGWGFRDEVR
ncbi:transposase IS200 family protein [Roseimicrobium gellanilyticum]|uniref:Transposase IS200 family protein n=2 Tax=Roseimicrobium gellanilyticum TaxID=748857 RepID=A0A366HFI4_9BACT|nr:transposase IS200 family protein [Roseimicrobium gellanilyticum]